MHDAKHDQRALLHKRVSSDWIIQKNRFQWTTLSRVGQASLWWLWTRDCHFRQVSSRAQDEFNCINASRTPQKRSPAWSNWLMSGSARYSAVTGSILLHTGVCFLVLDYVSLFWVRPFWTWDVRLSPRYRRSLWSSSPNSFSSLLEAPLEDSSVKRECFEEIYCSLYFSSLFFGGWHVMSNFLISMTCWISF